MELRKTIGKREIIKSLRTTDFMEAKRLVPFESANANALLDSARGKLQSIAKPAKAVSTFGESEIYRLVFEWFVKLEKQTSEWWEQPSIKH